MKSNLRKIKAKSLYQYKKRLSTKGQMKYVAKIYKRSIGEELSWSNPSTYTGKMQYAKLFDNFRCKSELTDKIEVREWIKEKIGEDYLIPLLGVYDNPKEINFEELPDKYVIKTNHASGTNIVINDSKNINQNSIVKRLSDWLNYDFAFMSDFEKHYSDIKPKILIESFVETPNDDLADYKFLCFDSDVFYCWVDVERFTNHKRNIYDLNWKLQPFTQYYPNAEYDIPKPKNFEKMIDLATTLCKGFNHVRVDLYNVDGKIYFGEMTFTSGGGYEPIMPKEYDLMLGRMWPLDTKEIK